MPVAREALGMGPDATDLDRLGYYLGASLLEPGRKAQSAFFRPAELTSHPLVSCVMPTRGRLFPARFAIECFRRQTYPNRELVVTSADHGCEVRDYVAELRDPTIVFSHVGEAQSVGTLRNAAVRQARGELICLWDDDDLSHPDRIVRQLGALRSFEVQACVLHRELIWLPTARKLAVSARRMWENSLLAERSALPDYPDVARGGDTAVAAALRQSARIVMIDHPASYCYVFHGGNLWQSDHFEMLLTHATELFEGERYMAALAGLAAELPFDAYAEGLREAGGRCA